MLLTFSYSQCYIEQCVNTLIMTLILTIMTPIILNTRYFATEIKYYPVQYLMDYLQRVWSIQLRAVCLPVIFELFFYFTLKKFYYLSGSGIKFYAHLILLFEQIVKVMKRGWKKCTQQIKNLNILLQINIHHLYRKKEQK